MPDFDVFSLLEIRKRKSRSHGIRKKGNGKRKKRAVKRSNTSLKAWSIGGSWSTLYAFFFKFLTCFGIAYFRCWGWWVLRWESSVVRCCTPDWVLYSACSPSICRFWSESQRRFIKIPFINKGIEFIDLPGVFGGGSVASSMPACFRSSEPPIICYKYNKPIRNTVFDFNKLVSGLGIRASTPGSWDCKDSKFVCPAAGHMVTGGLGVVSDSRIRYIVSKGPKYRFPSRVDFKKCREEIASALGGFGGRWCRRGCVGPGALKEWKVSIF